VLALAFGSSARAARERVQAGGYSPGMDSAHILHAAEPVPAAGSYRRAPGGRSLSPLDHWLAAADGALRTLAGAVPAARPMPQAGATGPGVRPAAPALTDDDRRLSGALMRVNHVGEVCAQALYQAQALTARSPALREQMLAAAREETDHLAWTQQRLDALGSRPSLLNPLWYGGAFAIGLAAGRLGDAVSLGFVVETERQVEAHLASHLQRLPEADADSRAVVAQMQADEARHADDARAAGGAELPLPVRGLMRLAARVMTTVAHRV
jgi:ubiquinone biosynthesis monooxygenase Coq7